jgi:mRNA interferase MazF
MNRGEVWWAQLPAPIGRRPVLLLSRDTMPAGRGEITVAYLTTTFRNTVVEVPVTQADGMPQDSVVNLDSINTIPKSALRNLICTLSQARMDEVKAAVIEALDLH